jgi:signal transduction histidine kinase
VRSVLKRTRERAGLVLLGGLFLLLAAAWNYSPLPDSGLVGLLACAVVLFIWRSDQLARHLRNVERKMELLLGEQRAERRAREEAEAAVRQRDELLSVASHELRSPITSLRGYVQWLPRQLERDGSVDANRLHTALRVIDQQSDKLTRLIGQLLDTSRAELGKLELEPSVVDLCVLARDVARSFEDTTGRSAAVRVPSWPVLTLADPLRLEQVLLNLLDNAAKFDQSGLPIEVMVDGPAAGRVTLSVRDHGAGVPPGDRERIFEPYAQTEPGRQAGGMGLGLYICRQIVAKHGGTIDVQSPAGGGARFNVTLRSLAETARGESGGAGESGAEILSAVR